MVFVALLTFVYLNSVFVIEPILDVWYFMLSSTMCCLKCLMVWAFMVYKAPGYVEPSLEWS